MTKPFVQILGFATSLMLVPAFSVAQGTLYKWIDARGHVHYSNTPTSTTATAVDDTLPPASSFKSPTPPPEAEKTPSSSTESKTTPEGEGGSTPGETASEDGAQSPPAGGTAEGPPASDGTGTSDPDARQEADGKPQLTPEQEQALRDSPM